jgi:hypothetical protein
MFSITALVLAALTAHATPSPKPTPARMLTLSLVETGGKATRTEVNLGVAVGGEVDAWVRGGDDQRFCRASADPTGDGNELRIELSCGPSRKATPDLRVKARRSLPLGRPVVLGEVRRADGRVVELRATLK